MYEFPDSNTRPLLFESYIAYRKAIFGTICQPYDIELANLIHYDDSLDAQIEQLLPYLTVGRSIETYQIDAHLIPIHHKYNLRLKNAELRISYFKRWFDHDRNEHPKGFIEINEP